MTGKRKEITKLTYTMILHDARRALNLTANEYIVADSIHRLASNPANPSQGWCWSSKESLGEGPSLSRKSVHELIDRLIEKGIVERHPETANLRTSQLWFDTVVVAKNALNEERIKKENRIAARIQKEARKLGMK